MLERLFQRFTPAEAETARLVLIGFCFLAAALLVCLYMIALQRRQEALAKLIFRKPEQPFHPKRKEGTPPDEPTPPA